MSTCLRLVKDEPTTLSNEDLWLRIVRLVRGVSPSQVETVAAMLAEGLVIARKD